MDNLSAHYSQIIADIKDDQANRVYERAMEAISVLNTAVTGLVVWLLLRRTPPEMSNYRWFLLFVALSSFLLDLWTNLFHVPILFSLVNIDAQGSCALGLIRHLGSIGSFIGWIVYILLLSLFGTSLVYAMLFRFLALKGRERLLFSKKAILLQALVPFLFVLPGIVVLVQYFQMFQDTPEYQDVRVFFDGLDCAVVANSRKLLQSFYVLCVANIAVTTSFLVLADRTLRALRSSITLDTFRYQRQLLWSLILQYSIPWALVATSIFVLNAALYLGRADSPMISRFCYAFASLHTTANGCLMLATVKPYRNAILHGLRSILGSQRMSTSSVSRVKTNNNNNDCGRTRVVPINF